jgi:hypothetical protein
MKMIPVVGLILRGKKEYSGGFAVLATLTFVWASSERHGMNAGFEPMSANQ